MLKERLDALVDGLDRDATRDNDPVSFVHRYKSDADREIVGLVASTLAFGNVVAVRKSVARVLDVLGPTPSQGIRGGPKRLEKKLNGFVHRVYRAPHVATMLANAARLQKKHGSLGDALHREVEAEGIREGLARFADRLRGKNAERGLRHLVPDPRAGSACKRLWLYLRWMVRPADGVDLGIWPLAPAQLLLPLDTHTHRISQNLGLTKRKDASWRTSEEITAKLRDLDPVDPVRYDFALCHLGVSRECPSRRDPEKCAKCVLKPVCRRWR